MRESPIFSKAAKRPPLAAFSIFLVSGAGGGTNTQAIGVFFWLFWQTNRWPWFIWWFNHLPGPSAKKDTCDASGHAICFLQGIV